MTPEDEKPAITVREAGKLGGEARKAEGADFAALGKQGGSSTARRWGKRHYSALGRGVGGRLKEERGPDYFREIGRKGGTQKGINYQKKREAGGGKGK